MQSVFGLTKWMSNLKILHIMENPVRELPCRDKYVGHLKNAVWYLGFSFCEGSEWEKDLHCNKITTFKDTAGREQCAHEYCNSNDHLKKLVGTPRC